MYVYTRMIFAAMLSPAIKIFHRYLGPNLLIFAVKVSPWLHRHFTVILWHITDISQRKNTDQGDFLLKRAVRAVYKMYMLDKMWTFLLQYTFMQKTLPGLYNSYQTPLALTSKETFFTRQQKHVTCQINKDTNLYYTTPMCTCSWIIINALNETKDA